MKLPSTVLATLVVFSPISAAEHLLNPVTTQGPVTITWQTPDKYTDIEANGELQSRFEQRVFKQLTQTLAQSAEKVLQKGEQLQLTVTNVDLAGDVRPTFGATSSDLRIVKSIYPPKISFSYKVMRGKNVLMHGEERLTDLNFLGGIRPLRDTVAMYEGELLKHWFNQTIAPRREGVPPK